MFAFSRDPEHLATKLSPPYLTDLQQIWRVPNNHSLVGEDFQLVTRSRSSNESRQVQKAASTAKRRNADFHIHNLKIMEGGFKGQDLLIKLRQ